MSTQLSQVLSALYETDKKLYKAIADLANALSLGPLQEPNEDSEKDDDDKEDQSN